MLTGTSAWTPVEPFPVPFAGERLDVLNDARVLVVCLFDEKRIVLDGRSRLLPEGGAGEKQSGRETLQRFSGEMSRNPGGSRNSSGGGESFFSSETEIVVFTV